MSRIHVLEVTQGAPSNVSGAHRSNGLVRAWRRLTQPRGHNTLYLHLDRPQSGDVLAGPVLPLAGWVCSPSERVRAVRVEGDGVRQRLEVRLARPDVAAAHPGAVGAPDFGFVGHVSTLGLPSSAELSLTALLDSGRCLPAGGLRIGREPLVSAYQPRFRPLLVCSFGRCGSSWLMRLLRQHPGIIVAGCFPHEVRAGQYWARLAHFLSQPVGAAGDPRSAEEWLLFEPRGWGGPEAETLHAWLCDGYVEELVATFQAHTDAYYGRVVACLGRPQPVYFAEKLALTGTLRLMRELYPATRVVFLVRDFRDMFCSIQAFNARRGFLAFGREAAASEEDYVQRVARWLADFRRVLAEDGSEALLVRYEDLVRQPEATLSRLFAGLGLDSGPELVTDLLARAAVETTGSDAHRTTPTQDQSIGRWRQELSARQRRLLQTAFGDLLAAFGYDGDNAQV